MTRLTCRLPLPAGFRPGDILAFHRRDGEGTAERVTPTALQKGLLWYGTPACLAIRFAARTASAELAVDGELPAGSAAALRELVRRMLGLDQDVESFEARFRAHPEIGPLLARQAGLRVPVAASPFEALSWAVTGQQISVGAAVSIRRKLILAAGVRHSGGLYCYPAAREVAALREQALRQAGFSSAKARTLLTLAQAVEAGALPFDDWLRTRPVDEIRQRLLALRGIGPWTVDYALLRGFGWLDGSLHGDVAVRRSLQTLLASPEPIGERQTRDWLAGFSPWRALLAAHLWAAQPARASAAIGRQAARAP